jgi:hypothetical protein
MSGKMSKLETAKKKRASIRQHGWLKGRLWYLHDTKPEGTLQHWLGRFLLDFVWGCLLNDPTAPFRREQEEIDADCRPKDKTAKAVTGKPGRPEETLAQWQARMRNGGRPVESKAIVLADDSSIERYEPRVRSEWPRRIVALAVALTFVGLAGYAVNRWYRPQPSRAEASPLTTSTVEPTSAPVLNVQPNRDPRFVQTDQQVGVGNRVTGNGLEGDTAPAMTDDMLKKAGHSAHLLSVYSVGAGLRDKSKVNTTNDLLTQDKTYLSQSGIDLWNQLSGAVHGAGTTVEVGEAPANGFNSGVHNGTFGQSRRAGIGGNRKCLIIKFRRGGMMIILKRCGNIVVLIEMFPIVPTEEELLPKVASEDPAAQGNAPEGGGHNDTDGPGQFRQPGEMVRPPATPRQNPPAPAPAPKPPVGSKPDPTPAPAPEPAAPTPAKPAEGEAPPPGGGSI